MQESLRIWKSLLAGFVPFFTAPTFRLFVEMMSGWVLCPGRRTVTRIYQIAEPEFKRSHDEYHRFFPDAAWILPALWRQMAVTAVALFRPSGRIPVDLDDTVFHKTGPKVDGAGWWRDAVRSTKTKVVHCFGLNLIILMARQCQKWQRVEVNMRGRKVLRLAAEYTVLWYHVCKTRPVKLVIARDPDGIEDDDFFFTTDVDLAPTVVIAQYSGRWSIEDTFRNTKQFVGGQDRKPGKSMGLNARRPSRSLSIH